MVMRFQICKFPNQHSIFCKQFYFFCSCYSFKINEIAEVLCLQWLQRFLIFYNLTLLSK